MNNRLSQDPLGSADRADDATSKRQAYFDYASRQPNSYYAEWYEARVEAKSAWHEMINNAAQSIATASQKIEEGILEYMLGQILEEFDPFGFKAMDKQRIVDEKQQIFEQLLINELGAQDILDRQEMQEAHDMIENDSGRLDAPSNDSSLGND